jgi:uncharacterized protein (DUF433 family)
LKDESKGRNERFLALTLNRWSAFALCSILRRIMSTNKLLERITIDPEICHGKPCIRGLRYPVTMLLELMSSGMTNEEILADYEDLERDDLLAALAYAARLSDAKRVALAG